MLIDKEVINAVINVVTVMVVACLADFLWMYQVFPFKAGGCKKYYRFITIKLLLINIIGGVVVPFYVTAGWYSGVLSLLGILSAHITMAYVIYLGRGEPTFQFIVFVLAELFGGMCLCITIVSSCFLLRQPLYLAVEIAREPTEYNLWLLIIGFGVSMVATRLCRPFFAWFRKGWIKYQTLWVLAAMIFTLLGHYSMISANFWNGMFLDAVYVATGSLLCLAAVSFFIYEKVNKAQLARLNQILILQQELLSGHYDAMKEQLRLTKEIRREIIFQVEALQQRLGVYHPSHEIQNYVDSLEEQQKQWCMADDSENSMLEYILYHRIEDCQKHQIKGKAKIGSLRCDKTTEWNLLSFFCLLLEHMVEHCGGERWIDVYIWQKQDEIYLKGCFSVLDTYRKGYIKQNILLKKMLKQCMGELLLVRQARSFEITVIISLNEMGV